VKENRTYWTYMTYFGRRIERQALPCYKRFALFIITNAPTENFSHMENNDRASARHPARLSQP
jgi:hypothetical protein